MAQMGFFDVENRYAALDAKHDPLVKIKCRRSLGSIPQPPGECLAQAARQAQVQGGVQTVGRHRHVQGHHSVRSLQSVG